MKTRQMSDAREGKQMNTTKSVKWLGLAALALVLGVSAAKADPNNANNTGTFRCASRRTWTWA
ncbi:MAG: hypothetical protein FD126_811 [Elusimicrobia bacterium]|nr:MAG: hypothetical protein FD126_811 [Elusimicrobiota bacterium]